MLRSWLSNVSVYNYILVLNVYVAYYFFDAFGHFCLSHCCIY
ncbi:hypothetical protein HanHA300_Chr16g0633271 [Helianthus annuus]|nr:hypothetical protein HanHA300_Chr16g0633271 [Helianthus annuus]